MAEDRIQTKVTRLSMAIYIPISLALAGAFFAASTVLGYSPVARYGGTVWVFLLSMIITMPTITPLVKRRLKR